MPIVDESLPSDMLQFEHSLTPREVERLASNRNLRCLQCSSNVDPRTWDLLNSLLFLRRPDVQLRVYGFNSSECDLTFLPRIRNVRHFSVDCVTQAKGTELLASLENLESLRVGVYNLNNFDFLWSVPSDLKKLTLEATKSKRPSLEPLQRFHSLSRLYLEGQQKDIEVLSKLQSLEDLTLRSISTGGLDFISKAMSLWSLDIKQGGITNLSAIEGMEQIKYLELWQVRGLSDLSVISTLYGLQYVVLQSLRHVRSLPDFSRLKRLRRVFLETMKGLVDVSALEGAPSLEDFIHIEASNIQPAQYDGLLKHPSLKRIAVGFGSDRKNRAFEVDWEKAGLERFRGETFVYL